MGSIEVPTLVLFVDAKTVEDSGPSSHYSGKKGEPIVTP
jgi:hypothetical protein